MVNSNSDRAKNSNHNPEMGESKTVKKNERLVQTSELAGNLPKNLSNNSLLSLTKSRSSGIEDNLEELKARLCMSSFSS